MELVKKIKEMTVDDALWYLRWSLSVAVILVMIINPTLIGACVVFIVALAVAEQIIRHTEIFHELNKISLQNAWSGYKYYPDQTVIASLRNFADQASGFLFDPLSELDKEGRSTTQRLAQSTRHILDHTTDGSQLTLIQRVFLYRFVEVEKKLKIIEVPDGERINRKMFGNAIVELALIMQDYEIALVEIMRDVNEHLADETQRVKTIQ